MRLIHVHGFAEIGGQSSYTTEYRKWLQAYFPQVQIQEFNWDTLDWTLTKVAGQFVESEKRTIVASERLAETISNVSEPVILSGFSLGGAVVVRSLLLRGGYQGLAGVILLGAAIPRNTRLPELKSSSECVRLNYYSKSFDYVLNHLYYNAINAPAAGARGFIEPMGFQNLETGCTHIRMKTIIDTSYCRLIHAVSILLAWINGIKGPGKAQKPWQLWAIGKMGDWDDIYHYKGYIIQQHFLTRNFRAIEDGGVHKEECWSKELWPILDTIKQKRQ